MRREGGDGGGCREPAGKAKGPLRRVQNVLGRWASWGASTESGTKHVAHGSNSSSAAGPGPFAASAAAPSAGGAGVQHHRSARSAGSDLELSTLNSTASSVSIVSSDAVPPDAATLALLAAGGGGGAAPPQRPLSSTLSHKSSAGSLGGANDASSVASGSAHHGSSSHHAGSLSGAGAESVCSIATQAGSAAHSFTSLQSMLVSASDAAGELGAGAGAGAAGGGGSGGPASPLSGVGPAGLGSLGLLYRGSDRGSDRGDATSVSTLPLISEAGYDDERLLEVQTLAEEAEEGEDGDASGDEGGAMPGAGAGPDGLAGAASPEGGLGLYHGLEHALVQPGRPRVSSSHGSITSNASEGSGPALSSAAGGSGGGAAPAAVPGGGRVPSPGGFAGRSLYSSGSQRSGSRHSFQAAQTLPLEEEGPCDDGPEADADGDGAAPRFSGAGTSGAGSASLPVPFSSRRRPDNDDCCSFATQAGSSVHSISSVLSLLESQPQPRQGHAASFSSGDGGPAAGLGSRGPSLNQQHAGVAHPLQPGHGQQQRGSGAWSRQSSGSYTRQGSGARQQHGGPFAAASAAAAAGGSSRPPSASPRGARTQLDGAAALGQQPDDAAGGASLQRKGSLKGAIKSITRWGSGLGQRLQRAGSAPSSQPPPGGPRRPDVGSSNSSQEMVGL